ncbi:hypothetical protein [Pseudomonas pisciculturae]|nr:hypothetical protein [Pseudomonas pisciculturae]
MEQLPEMGLAGVRLDPPGMPLTVGVQGDAMFKRLFMPNSQVGQ